MSFDIEVHDLSHAVTPLTGDELVRISQHTIEKSAALSEVEDYINRTRWDDLRFPAQGINPAGTAAPPSVDATTYPGTLLFAHNADNHIAGVAQMPHAWERGTAVIPHVHWAKSTSASGGVVWQIRYAVADIGGTYGAYSDWQTATSIVSHSNTAHKHALDSFAEIDMTWMKESTIILWEIRRYTDHANDNYGASCRLYEFDFHFRVTKQGTLTEIPE